jgi:hypothetical protein
MNKRKTKKRELTPKTKGLLVLYIFVIHCFILQKSKKFFSLTSQILLNIMLHEQSNQKRCFLTFIKNKISVIVIFYSKK